MNTCRPKSILVSVFLLILTHVSLAGTLFYDDFEDGKWEDSWEFKNGDWSVSNGELTNRNSGGESRILLRDSEWNNSWVDYYAECRVMLTLSDVQKDAGIMARVRDNQNFYFAEVKADAFKIQNCTNGSWSTVVKKEPLDPDVEEGVWHTLGFRVQGSNLKEFFNGELIIQGDNSNHGSGKIGLRSFNKPMKYDYVLVTTLDQQPTALRRRPVPSFSRQTVTTSVQIRTGIDSSIRKDIFLYAVTADGRLIRRNDPREAHRLSAGMHVFVDKLFRF